MHLADLALNHLALPIPGLSGYYATRSGLIVRCRESPRGGTQRKDGKPKRSAKAWIKIYQPRTHHRTGHFYVNLWSEGKHGTYLVPRLVVMAHRGPPPEDQPFAAHRDGVVRNNSAANLVWSSHADNVADREYHRRHGRGAPRPPEYDQNGMLISDPEPPTLPWWQRVDPNPDPEYHPDPDLGF